MIKLLDGGVFVIRLRDRASGLTVIGIRLVAVVGLIAGLREGRGVVRPLRLWGRFVVDPPVCIRVSAIRHRGCYISLCGCPWQRRRNDHGERQIRSHMCSNGVWLFRYARVEGGRGSDEFVLILTSNGGVGGPTLGRKRVSHCFLGALFVSELVSACERTSEASEGPNACRQTSEMCQRTRTLIVDIFIRMSNSLWNNS